MEVINDEINLNGAPHTVCEIVRESLSTVDEKSDHELYEVIEEEENPKETPEENPEETPEETPEEGEGE